MPSLRSAWPVAASLVILAGCTAGISSSLKRRVADEHAALLAATKAVQQADQTVQHNLAADADLFKAAAQPAKWSANLEDARHTLATARETDRELGMLAARNRADNSPELERLLIKERTLRQAATNEAQTSAADSDKWVNFRHDLQANLDRMSADHTALQTFDSSGLASTVEKAEHDWPAKKTVLDDRLTAIRAIGQSAESVWDNSANARDDAAKESVSGGELATLIETSETLANDRSSQAKQAGDLGASAGQLYNAWDKLLIDLEQEHGEYRERIRTVQTHFTDVAAKQTETSSNERWIDVPPGDYRSVEDDLGMAIAHKDAGQFDSEAVNTPQPAGFAYIAPDGQGSNQYGYWAHENGHSIWTWLPEYLILRELLWNHSYRPVILEDYRGFQTAQRAGHTYFGRSTSGPVSAAGAPATAPEYGTHGSFTRTTYANSRYVQSGSFKQSAYASHPGSPARSMFGDSHAQSNGFRASSDGASGKRFGTGAAPSSGHRFGHSAPSRSFGKSFGRRR